MRLDFSFKEKKISPKGGLTNTPIWCINIGAYKVIQRGKMTIKRKAVYDLAAFKATFKSVEKLAITTTALKNAADLGFGRQEIVETIQTMQPQHFYQSMTSYADHRIWQDVYHVPSVVGVLYIKFTADVLTDFLLLSFKEKADGS